MGPSNYLFGDEVKREENKISSSLQTLLSQLKPDTLTKYYEVQRQFVRELCPVGTDATYNKKLAGFNGDGHYVPLLPDGSLDSETIIQDIPLFEEKINWLEQNIQIMKQISGLDFLIPKLKDLEDKIDIALEYKKQFFESLDNEEKKQLQVKSSAIVKEIQIDFESFLTHAPFFKPFKYPVDHLSMRGEYDRFKFREDILGNKFSNRVLFTRRILEDGAPTHNKSKNDVFYRTLINTLHYSLAKEQIFLEEDNRYDLSSFLTISRNLINYGLAEQKLRLEDWRNREIKKLNYYRLILRNQIYQEGGPAITVKEYVEKKLKARDELRSFVLEKYVDVYKYWTKYLEIHQALFAMETILFNEVGTMDGPGAPERRDVLRVVKNRHTISFYANLGDREPLALLLQQQKFANVSQYSWLNLLLKEGEFSFTYYYMHGAPKVFCPDQDALSIRLRKENLELALNVLKENYEYHGVRYFSRASMIGRINMASLWDEFFSLPEGAGSLMPDWKFYWNLYSSGQYRFLYHFFDQEGRTFKVVEIKGKTVVIPFTGEAVYYYRDPNLFRYFATR